jgi:hypothetical protein
LEGALKKRLEHGSVLTTDGWRGCFSVAHNRWHDVADGNNGENFQLEELASWNTSWKDGRVWIAISDVFNARNAVLKPDCTLNS